MNRILIIALALGGCTNSGMNTTCVPTCAPGYACVEGACVLSGGLDMSVSNDAGGGKCDPVCGGLTPYCNATGHCVGCTMDAQCPQGRFCKVVSDAIANCAIGCMNDDRCGGGKCCNGACADVANDAANCGSCGNQCGGSHAQAKCSNGQCAPGACDPGWGDCDGNAQNGCEANLHADPKNCTACGTTCALNNAITGCADGCYVSACNFGYDNCDDDDKNGCEQSVLTDINNCGGCGTPCNKLPNASASCTNGNCVLGKCNTDYANCDGNPMNGCEAYLPTDPMNCGACGNVCPQNMQFCNMNACTAVNPIKCSQAALMWCTQKGFTVPQGGQAAGGRLYCTKGVGTGSDCNQCIDYNMIVWVDGAKPLYCQNFNYTTKAGRVYAGHSPCQCGDNLIDCGTWTMQNCIPD